MRDSGAPQSVRKKYTPRTGALSQARSAVCPMWHA